MPTAESQRGEPMRLESPRLTSLRERHAHLDARIQAEYSHAHPDDTMLKRLKLAKLRLKEEIDRLKDH